jgi:cysteine desulfurase
MAYFDNNATTEIAPTVLDAIRQSLEASFANGSAAYEAGREARRSIESSRSSVAALVGARTASEITFTSGGTESDNWAILGALEANPKKRHIITTAVEHDAVRKLCQKLETRGFRVTWLGVDASGCLDLDALRGTLAEDTAVVSVMLANNETGILFPVNEIAQIVKERSDAIFHVDGVNAAGKIAIDLKDTQIDLFSISAHKFHGPKGVGALYIRDGVTISPLFSGGGQENGQRPGTEAVHQIAGIGAAAEFVKDLSPMKNTAQMRNRLENEILKHIPNSRLIGTADPSKRLPNTSNIAFENTNGEMILALLDAQGICVSTGSACNSHDHKPSHVLAAMGVPYAYAMGSIRISLGRTNTVAEVKLLIDDLPGIVSKLRGSSIVG